MARLLLVHGSCHGAWCWRDVVPALQARGHEVRAIDLPGHGADPTPRETVTLHGYARAILAALEGPTLVVGHSMAGYPITAAAELDPAQMAGLVYLCAYRPVSGLSLADMRRAGPRQPLRDAIRVEGACFSFDAALAEDRFYHDCPPGTLDYALAHLTPQPILPQETPLVVTGRSASVPQHYIRCAEDRAIPPEYQATMAQGVPPGRVHDLPSSHSPFFAMPDRLADLLSHIATNPDC
ncbi:MAG: alpha/beta fold hydrolase [Gemmobacter sp.]|nr:alpha/beta fold hydrolase [Gemmobacter sp.]